MNLQNLLDDLNDLCCILETEYDINNGGCCFLAYIIAREFDERDIKYSLIVRSSSYKNELIVSEEVNRMKEMHPSHSCVGYETCSHYFLKVGDTYINRDYNNDFDEYDYELDIPIPNCVPIKWIYEHGIWNISYDTNNNYYVEDLIKNLFNNYDKE